MIGCVAKVHLTNFSQKFRLTFIPAYEKRKTNLYSGWFFYFR